MAADDLRVEVHGAAELADAAKLLARNVTASAPRTMGDRAAQAADTVRGKVPHVSGRLAGAVTSGLLPNGAWVGYADGVPYAGWIEYGGNRMGGQGIAVRKRVKRGRYLRPAVRTTEKQLLADAERQVTNEIEGVRWPRPTV